MPITQIGNLKLQFPGILHSSRFSPILKVNNPSHSNPQYSILIVSTSLFNTDIFYNATLLSTKEIRLSMRVDCTIVWECERQFSMSPKTTGARSRESIRRQLLRGNGDFHSQSKHFPAHQYFLSRRKARQKAEYRHLELGKNIFFCCFFGFIFKLVEI